jgi:RNA-directed DNA polymerase
MNVTKDGFKNRQLHIEDYLQMVSAEQKEYAEVFDYQRITENNDIITDFWMNNLMELILRKDNLNKAYQRVKSNKGASGTDGMQVDELLPYLKENQIDLTQKIAQGKYKPNPVRRVEIPKEEKGKVRLLGIPTVTS